VRREPINAKEAFCADRLDTVCCLGRPDLARRKQAVALRDIIAEKTGLGRTWIGVILLATVTSLPELATGVSAVTLAKAPDLAVGDALGSCVFNLMIVTLLDFLQREESVFTRASQGHILSAGFGVILIGLVGFSLSLQRTWPGLSIGHIGLSTPIILMLYAVAMRTVFRYERRQRAAAVEEAVEQYGHVAFRRAVVGYSASALVVAATGTLLPFIGERLAAVMGWQQTFVGTLFLAFATSVPEAVVTIAAVRLGALDLAVSNLLGSNLFDIAIIAIDDVCFLPGHCWRTSRHACRVESFRADDDGGHHRGAAVSTSHPAVSRRRMVESAPLLALSAEHLCPLSVQGVIT